MKKKCYVIILSEHFPKSHSKKGQETGFNLAIKHYTKLHTIRDNYDFWEKRFKEIDKGNAYLSVRQWSGKPYRSKQKEIYKFDNTNNIGIEKLELNQLGWMCIGNHVIDVNILAKNDGLAKADFVEWFKDFKIGEEKAIIHFSGDRYLCDSGELRFDILPTANDKPDYDNLAQDYMESQMYADQPTPYD